MKYIASFVRKNYYKNFCLPELISVCEMLNANMKYDENYTYDVDKDPMIEIDIPSIENSDIAQKICDRAVCTRNIIKIYSEGETFEDLISNLDMELFKDEIDSLTPYKFDVDSRGKVIKYIYNITIIVIKKK